ncbi:MAG TPA: malto-oligosyltrehalose trehalohydrolase [Opitutaceae bacterium]|jgi:maltooligosyltrehalose trehalohydrolase
MSGREPIGASIRPGGGVTYRVWAPDHTRLEVAIGEDAPALQRTIAMVRDASGVFEACDPMGRAGDLYGFRIDGDESRAPDPSSRFQPRGVLGPSEVIDPSAYEWKRAHWHRPSAYGRVIYELHVGTFTPDGTFAAAIAKLDAVAALGVNTIELMPLGDFPGRWNWGYDGVMLYAPARCYGRPDDLRALVDAAHGRDLAVVLDVVYNHFGPVGNPLPRYSRRYNHEEKESPWGRSFNFDGEQSEEVRRFFAGNAAYWLDEFRFDGLRLDATHAIHDESRRHILAEIAARAAERGAFTIAEDERNEASLVLEPPKGGAGLSAVWADDFHHSVRVALTGDRHSYFAGYTGECAENAEILQHGWLYHGQIFPPTGQPRGTPADRLAPESLVYCINNHDQTGNRALGERLAGLTTPAAYRAAAVLLCLAPYTPMIFMGDEWGASTPFLFFSDHPGEVGEKMAFYRKREFAAQPPDVLARMPDPQAESTFRASKLDWDERNDAAAGALLKLHCDALRLRSQHRHFQNPPRDSWSAAAAGGAVLLRWRGSGAEWLLICALQPRAGGPVDHPMAQPPAQSKWMPVINSDDPAYGGERRVEIASGAPVLTGPAAVLYRQS